MTEKLDNGGPGVDGAHPFFEVGDPPHTPERLPEVPMQEQGRSLGTPRGPAQGPAWQLV